MFFESKNNTKKKEYRASSKICIDCPLKGSCLGKSKEKKFTVTFYRDEYERNNQRINSRQGRYMKGKRQSTVEPVFGTLTQFLGLRKINTIGIKQANKVMHLSAIAYNLKKYLKFVNKKVKSGVKTPRLTFLYKNFFIPLIYSVLRPLKFRFIYC
ncbi:transposase [Polaribacter sp. Hel_I_88]|uniref:transposase n=1 Tax=Polaribacter sp. Hel_I_88 TaxID=1250006 RepID=UPI000A533099|nr:transposase [Polaribacter sp. Hel_I_88]